MRDLLVADLAVGDGLASPADVADVLARQWQRRESGDAGRGLLDALALAIDLDPGDVLRLSAKADRLIAEASGSPELALSRRHGGAGTLHAALVSKAPALTRALAATGAGPVPDLRPMDPGRYTDLTPVGEGGMGTVYRAYDADLDRPVALKVVRGDVAGPDVTSKTVASEVVARFLREARLTGRLEHAGIVPVHEVGRTEGGLPYYAMRLVRDSKTLAQAIDAAWDLGARLALLEPFLKVCDTVAYAHGQGVIHRDLKPQNVALGAYGEVVVLDWGLAKAVGVPDGGDRPAGSAPVAASLSGAGERPPTSDAFLTQTGVLGTVGYLPPEALGLGPSDAAPALDVFSLGVILYQILTGRLPWPYPDVGRYATALREDAPAPTSIEPLAPEGLAAIAMKAIARERAARFATAGELATALRTWQTATAMSREQEARAKEAAAVLAQAESLQGEPALRQIERLHAVLAPLLAAAPDHVQAREIEAAGERVRERAMGERDAASRRRARRRTGMTALVVLTAGAIGFSVFIQQRNRDLKEANDRAIAAKGEESKAKKQAQGEREQAEGVLEYMLFPLHDALGPAGQTDILRRSAERAVAYYESLSAASLSPESKHRYHAALTNLGIVLDEVGDPAGAVARHTRARDLAKAMRDAAPSDVRPFVDWVTSERRLADLEAKQVNLATALAHDERTLKTVRKSSEAVPESVEVRRALADVEMDRVGRLTGIGRYAEAVERCRAALAIYEQLGKDTKDPQVLEAIPATHVRLAIALMGVSATNRDALEELREPLEYYERRVQEAPRDLVRRADLAWCLQQVAKYHLDHKEIEYALSPAGRALALRREAAALDPESAARQTAFADASIDQAITLGEAGDGERASEYATTARSTLELVSRERSADVGVQALRARAEYAVALSHKVQLRMKDALTHAQVARTLARALPEGSKEQSRYAYTVLVEDVTELASLFPELPDGERRLAVSMNAISRATDAVARRNVAVAYRNWIVALRVQAIREDLTKEHFYAAISVGSQYAAQLRPGADREEVERLTLAWLVDDLKQRRKAANADGAPDERAARLRAFEVHVKRVRGGDKSLEVLRARPEFAAEIDKALAG